MPMNITLYTLPTCPQCHVLKTKLDAAGISYQHFEGEEAILALGKKGAPILAVDDATYCGPQAIKWFNEWRKAQSNGN